jgi:hypothetical protein
MITDLRGFPSVEPEAIAVNTLPENYPKLIDVPQWAVARGGIA